MPTQLFHPARPWSGRTAGTRPLYSGEELTALHTHLVLRFRSMITEHRSKSAFVEAYPKTQDSFPNEILVIPLRCGAALFSVGFLQTDHTRMEVRIGEHCVLRYAEAEHGDEEATASFAETAEQLFRMALNGRYREEIWTNTFESRYLGGQSFYLDDDHSWQRLGPCLSPPALLSTTRPKITVHDRRYQAY